MLHALNSQARRGGRRGTKSFLPEGLEHSPRLLHLLPARGMQLFNTTQVPTRCHTLTRPCRHTHLHSCAVLPTRSLTHTSSRSQARSGPGRTQQQPTAGCPSPLPQIVPVGLAGLRLKALGPDLRREFAHPLSLPLSRSQAQAGARRCLPLPVPLLCSGCWPQRTGQATGLGCRLRSVFPVSSSRLGAPSRPGCCSGCLVEELGELTQGREAATCTCRHIHVRG